MIMALEDFWSNVRIGAKFSAPQGIVDLPRLDADGIERTLRDVSRNDDEFLKVAQRLRAMLDPISRRVAPDRWPYLSFRPIAEPAEAVETP
jgi:hypothetical protein